MAMVTMTMTVLTGAAGTRMAMAMVKLSYSGSEQTVAILDSEQAVARLSLSNSERVTG
jgi:hypothetical protein